MARNDYGIEIVTPATLPGITLEEAKKQLELTGTTHHDEYVTAAIKAAERRIRDETNYQFNQQIEKLHLKRFPNGDGAISIPVFPIQSIDKVEYVSEEGTSIEVDAADYATLLNLKPNRIEPALDWPTDVRDFGESVAITYTCGHATEASIEELPKQALKILTAIIFVERTGTPINKLIHRHGDLGALYASLRDSLKYGDDFVTFGH